MVEMNCDLLLGRIGIMETCSNESVHVQSLLTDRPSLEGGRKGTIIITLARAGVL